jgi:signal transduction histidine kinase
VIEDYPNLREHRQDIELKQPLLEVLGTEPLLTQSIANLLNNAIKFMPASRAPKIQVWSERADGRVRLHVSDNGVGIPREEQQHLFQMFSRGANSNGVEGNGIGLAIVRRAIERMGGTVGVNSTPGEGSDFWIEVPAPNHKP